MGQMFAAQWLTRMGRQQPQQQQQPPQQQQQQQQPQQQQQQQSGGTGVKDEERQQPPPPTRPPPGAEPKPGRAAAGAGDHRGSAHSVRERVKPERGGSKRRGGRGGESDKRRRGGGSDSGDSAHGDGRTGRDASPGSDGNDTESTQDISAPWDEIDEARAEDLVGSWIIERDIEVLNRQVGELEEAKAPVREFIINVVRCRKGKGAMDKELDYWLAVFEDPRMREAAYGVACLRNTCRGKLLYLSRGARRRGEVINTMINDADWSWMTALYVCRMSTGTLDKFMAELDVSFARDHQAVVRATERKAKTAVDDQGDVETFWWEDEDAEVWDGDLTLEIAQGEPRAQGGRGRGRAMLRPRRTLSSERVGYGGTASVLDEARFQRQGRGQGRSTSRAPTSSEGSRGSTRRDGAAVQPGGTPLIPYGELMQDARHGMTTVRTATFTDEFVRELDDQNRQRMACLPPAVQAHVAATYSTGDREGGLRDVQKHFSGVIGGVRRLCFHGMTVEESNRLVALAVRGKRVSYRPCDYICQGKRCQYGDECTHPHVYM